jgi:hypothetical protein
MPLPDEVRVYLERKKKGCDRLRLFSADNSIEDPTNPDSPSYMRGYVGAGHRMSGEEADRQLLTIMADW